MQNVEEEPSNEVLGFFVQNPVSYDTFNNGAVLTILNRLSIIWDIHYLSNREVSEVLTFVMSFIIFRCYPKTASLLVSKIKVKTPDGIHISHGLCDFFPQVQLPVNFEKSELHA
jgi:hypothetical protein